MEGIKLRIWPPACLGLDGFGRLRPRRRISYFLSPLRGPNLRKPTRICFGEIQHAYLLDLKLFGASRNICSVVSIDGSIESMVHVLDMYYPSLR